VTAVAALPARAAEPQITIAWAGDTVPASREIGLPAHPWRLLAGVTPILARADLAVVNLEGVLTRRGRAKCQPDGATCFVFRSPPAYARILRGAGIDAVNLANNHSLDFGRVGLADTRAALTRRGIGFTGTPGRILVRTVHGVRVAVIGFAPYPWASPLLRIRAAQALVRAAHRRAPVVLVAIHAGAEGVSAQHVTGREEIFLGEDRGNPRRFARAMIAAGATAVVGSGPHVLRGIEIYRHHPIVYSTGNFAGWHTFSLGPPRATSAIVELRVDALGRFIGGRVRPTRLVGGGNAAPDPAGAAIPLMRRLSHEDFGRSALLPGGSFGPGG
jgi:poly-gamma-glutamate capsule biosynthesis protein CapA/YwtB (metallophosphatase superfamily)